MTSHTVLLYTTVVALFVAATAAAQTTYLASQSSTGEQGSADSTRCSISADGRFVAFQSFSPNLVPDDTNGVPDAFVRDMVAGTTERISVSSAGVEGDLSSGFTGLSQSTAISDDGRFIAFMSDATNLVPNDTNGQTDVFVRDRTLQTTVRVSVSTAGVESDGFSFGAAIAYDGSCVAFRSNATNLVANDNNNRNDVFLHDLGTGVTELVSIGLGGAQANGDSWEPALSGDGRFVAFYSDADNLVANDTNGDYDTFVRDRLLGVTELINVDSSGVQGTSYSYNGHLSADGRYVAFDANSGFAPNDNNGKLDVYVRDRLLGTTELITVHPSGMTPGGGSWQGSISDDGRYVAFHGYGKQVPPFGTGLPDVYCRDRLTGVTEYISMSMEGSTGWPGSVEPNISRDGRHVAFFGSATNLVPGDTNGEQDVFVRDREICATSPTAYCTAGTSASGCNAMLSATGAPSATSGSGFVVTVDGVEGNKDGLFFYGQNGRQATSWGSGSSFRCIVPPVRRGGLMTGTGTNGACDAQFSQDLNERWCTTCPKPGHAPVAGKLQIQFWYRDPQNTSNQTTSLSDALEVDVCP